MKFANPHMFYLIWTVIILLGFVVYGCRKRAETVRKFISNTLMDEMTIGYSEGRKWLKGTLLVLTALFLVLALTGPLVGFRWEEVKEKGVDIMIALDCSRSMLATDIKPTRLEQAKREIIDLLNMMGSDRAGLVAFAGSAILQCPLTLDHSGFTIFLNALNPDYLPMGGTDIAGAINTAVIGFEADSDSEKAIIIITDGESTSGDEIAVATEAAKKGIRLFCIGVGQEDGAPVPDENGGFKKDDSGKIVMSKVDDEGLRKLAAIGNGVYVRSVAGDMDLDLIYKDEIQKNMKKTTLHSGRTRVWENRFQWPLLPALIFLIIEIYLPERKRDSKGSSSGISLLVIILSFTFFTAIFPAVDACAGSSASVKKGIEAYEKGKYDESLKNFIDAQLERPELPELYYNIGSAAYKKGDYETALSNFIKAKESKDNLLKDKSLFNLGNTKYRMGDLEGAAEEFKKIPESSELYKDAKDNLEFVNKKIEERRKEKEQNKDKKEDKDKQDKESNNKDQKNGQNPDKQKSDEKKPDQQNKDQQNKDQQDKDSQQQQKNPQQQPDKDSNNGNNQDQQQNSGRKDGEKMDGEKKDKNSEMQNKINSPEDKQQKEAHQEKFGAGKEEQNKQEKDDNNQEKSGEPQNSAAQSGSSKAGDEKSGAQSRQYLLNRLEDKPGSAMMPEYSEKSILKDW